MKHIVVAYDRRRGIGAHGELPWGHDLPSDLQRFQELTLHRTVIMGRMTLESIGHPLPGRQNIVVTRDAMCNENVLAVRSLSEAYRRAQAEPVVIGGMNLYKDALDSGEIDIIHATEIDATFRGVDRYFPVLDETWHETAREAHQASGRDKYNFSFVTYQPMATEEK